MVGFVSLHQIWLQISLDITNQRCLSTQTGVRTKTLSGLSKGTETNTIYIYYINTEERNKHKPMGNLIHTSQVTQVDAKTLTSLTSNGRYVYLDFLNWRWITLLIMNRTASCTSISSLQHHGHLWTPMMYQRRSLVVVYTPRHSLRHRHNAEHLIRPQAHFFWFQVCISNLPMYHICHLLIWNLLRMYENT